MYQLILIAECQGAHTREGATEVLKEFLENPGVVVAARSRGVEFFRPDPAEIRWTPFATTECQATRDGRKG